eukprot:TRINITY_DN5410_c0_g2_i2.p1 TRINITY_DN5410_c0_g2~~TRINITY_DN5410_c0_g2_i2.p1  ORF type:complete len:270 (-),score=16.32 TRINITY_DN5410_c0_g2_i2:109-918(-)
MDRSVERAYECGCGRKYLSYPSLYMHIKVKHEGRRPRGTRRPSQRPRIRNSGRPSTFWNSSQSFSLIEDARFTSHNDLYCFLGNLGDERKKLKREENLVYANDLKYDENNPLTEYYGIFYGGGQTGKENSPIFKTIQDYKLRLMSIQELIANNDLDCIDELGLLLEKLKIKDLKSFLASVLSWISEKLQETFFKELCFLFDVIEYSIQDINRFSETEGNIQKIRSTVAPFPKDPNFRVFFIHGALDIDNMGRLIVFLRRIAEKYGFDIK